MGEMLEGEPFFVPLAFPLLAGPSTLAMLILLARSQPERIFEWLAAVLGAWAVTSLIMLSSSKLNKLFGKRRTHYHRTSEGYGSGGNFRTDADGWDINFFERIDNPLIPPVQVFFKCKKILSFPF